MRRAKIVCTLGPATTSAENLRELVRAGMDVARLNLSHGDHADHERVYGDVRAASDATGRAVGILVDQAIVTIENIERHLNAGEELNDAILIGAGEIGVPAFVSTLCICIVFVPVAFITGAAKSLFIPLALSVVFAMMTSYFLSRTLVPTMVRFLLAREGEHHVPNRFFAARRTRCAW